MDDLQRASTERAVVVYNDLKAHAAKLEAQIQEYKDFLVRMTDEEGEDDEKGNRLLAAGKYLLQRQRRESKRSLDVDAAKEWALARGILDQVTKIVTVLDEDAFFGYIYDNRDVEGLEDDMANSCFRPPKVTYAFMPPVEVKNYDY